MPTKQSHAQCHLYEPLILGSRHRPSYHAAREEIKHNGKGEPSFIRPDGGDIAGPLLVGPPRHKIALEQIGSDACFWIAVGRSCAMASTASAEPQLSHQASYALARAADPLLAQLDVQTRTAVELSIGVISGLNLLS